RLRCESPRRAGGRSAHRGSAAGLFLGHAVVLARKNYPTRICDLVSGTVSQFTVSSERERSLGRDTATLSRAQRRIRLLAAGVLADSRTSKSGSHVDWVRERFTWTQHAVHSLC